MTKYEGYDVKGVFKRIYVHICLYVTAYLRTATRNWSKWQPPGRGTRALGARVRGSNVHYLNFQPGKCISYLKFLNYQVSESDASKK